MNKFANILFAGPCNAACPDCIGNQIRSELSPNNLVTYPLRNLDLFIDLIKQELITELSFTGTTTDPLLYQHQEKLIEHLREEISTIHLSIHTNGRLVKKMIHTVNLYDRVAVSIPSFDEQTYQRIMGTRHIPDLGFLVKNLTIPLKLSALIDDSNKDIIAYLDHCLDKGIQRVVFRRLFGESRLLQEIIGGEQLNQLTPAGYFMNNPVFTYKGIQVTLREFETTTNKVYNLFADGTIYNGYLLTNA